MLNLHWVDHLHRRTIPLVLALGLLVATIGTMMAPRGAAEGETDAAVKALSVLSVTGPELSPVAIVNGVPITMATLRIHAVTAGLFGVDSKSQQELLNGLIDSELLAQAAVKAGVEVSSDEVDGAIRSGILDPLSAKTTPKDVRDLIIETLKAQGVTPGTVLESPGVRKAYTGLVLRGRYLLQAGATSDELLPGLRESADIRIFLDGS